MKISKKKTLGDFIILHKYTANHDYLLYCSSDMACDGCNCFSFWTICCPFTILYCQYFHPLTTQKIKISKKMKKNTGDIIILHMCTKNYDKMMYRSWDIVHDRWRDRWMDRKSDIQRWVPHLKTKTKSIKPKLLKTLHLHQFAS